jgi:rhodanese-related sulfurtransferase
MNTITVEELKARLDAGEKLNLVDVREAHEHAEFNIGGIHLPVGNIMMTETDSIDDLKEQEVIFYCRSGARSGQACLFTANLGFTNTFNLVGGMLAWREKFGE